MVHTKVMFWIFKILQKYLTNYSRFIEPGGVISNAIPLKIAPELSQTYPEFLSQWSSLLK